MVSQMRSDCHSQFLTTNQDFCEEVYEDFFIGYKYVIYCFLINAMFSLYNFTEQNMTKINLNTYDPDDVNNEVGGVKPLHEGNENNGSANDRVDKAAKAAGLNVGQIRKLHDVLKGEKTTYEKIYAEALTVKKNYPNK